MEDWLDELLDIEEQWDDLEHQPRTGPMRTKAYWAARHRRVQYLREMIDLGKYVMPSAELVADGILYGQPKWGEALIDDWGRRLDEL